MHLDTLLTLIVGTVSVVALLSSPDTGPAIVVNFLEHRHTRGLSLSLSSEPYPKIRDVVEGIPTPTFDQLATSINKTTPVNDIAPAYSAPTCGTFKTHNQDVRPSISTTRYVAESVRTLHR